MRSLLIGKRSKRGMMQTLTQIGFGIVTLAILVVVGLVVIANLGNTVGGQANVTAQFLATQLGQQGLSGWIPAIIAVAVGGMFLSYFMVRPGRRV